MTNAIGRAVAVALLAALLGAAWTALLYAWQPALHLEFDRDLPRNVSGVFPPERDDATRLTFAWTGAESVLRLPGLDRSKPWTLSLRLRGGRTENNPELAVLADGLAAGTAATGPAWSDVSVEIPARPERRGLVIGLRPSTTFVPGPGDARALGVMLDSLSLTTDRGVLVPRPALMGTSAASAAIGAALALLGVTLGSAVGGAVLVSAGAAAVVTRGFGPFTDYPDTVVRLGVAVAIALAVLSFAWQTWRQPLRNTARFAAAFTAAAVFLKLLVLLHPDMPIGDAMFHAHRFQGVLAGNLYFTSIAPGGYAFPYPPGLYVFTSALAWLARRGPQDVVLLRVATASVDAAAGLLLYPVIAGVWRNRLAAAMAVAIYHLIPIDFAVLTTGNLTNAFAQSVAVSALALIGSGRVVIRRPGMMALLAGLLAAAYLSHTSTIAIVFVATIVIAGLMFFAPRAEGRSAAAAIVVATVAAAVLSIAIYYAHFGATYRSELARIGQETAANASDAGGRTISDRLAGVPYSIGLLIGWPVFLLALAGAWLRIKQGADSLALTAAGWAVACAIFLAIGILTPVDMRYYLAAIPVFAIAAAYGGAWAWTDSPASTRLQWRIAAALALVATTFVGVRHWWSVLG